MLEFKRETLVMLRAVASEYEAKHVERQRAEGVDLQGIAEILQTKFTEEYEKRNLNNPSISAADLLESGKQRIIR